ncbi:uncharacterized protein K460DRAFT_419061 [Cucurbitaria berberidis CBS 394.84]|uniref:RNase H type-1 domain-containing protein n=1 Tax=Cucurbitaria berberidis CBS 394.84 TaxID=1168544 RepID=A0A9P4L7H1_9PLEO|nr:uncharacterized protein K460DRAFT_419061 [Cucurbitaria berberidis CBS 394.84]KAF1844103.1 hypothetical protein K460DRAFT_419061 [Cucurbitaria berberidis CBS 394.84]
MTRAKNRTAKVRPGLKSYLERAHLLHEDDFKVQLPPTIPKIRIQIRTRKHGQFKLVHITRAEWQTLHSEARSRRRRLFISTIPDDCTFAGQIILPDADDARKADAFRLSDIKEAWKEGRAAVYWVDGSLRKGILAAGVVWQDNQHTYTASYRLGRDTGDSGDAEVFAIAAGLGKAKKEVERGTRIELVRIFSDALCILQGLRNRTCETLGPMLKERMALQAVYERAEWLSAQGIRVQLVWVKGHSGSDGNAMADEAATLGVKQQVASYATTKEEIRVMTHADVPTTWQELGSDWADEWLWRANRNFYDVPTRLEERRKTQNRRLYEDSELDEHFGEVTASEVSDLSDDVPTYAPLEGSSLDQQVAALELHIRQRGEKIADLRLEIAKISERKLQMIRDLDLMQTEQRRDQSYCSRMAQHMPELRRTPCSEEDDTQHQPDDSLQQPVLQNQATPSPRHVETAPTHSHGSHDDSGPGSFGGETRESSSSKPGQTQKEPAADEPHMEVVQPASATPGNVTIDPLLLETRRRYDVRVLQIADLKQSIADAKTGSTCDFLAKVEAKLELEQASLWQKITSQVAETPAQGNEAEAQEGEQQLFRSLAVPEHKTSEQFESPNERWVGGTLLSLLENEGVQGVQDARPPPTAAPNNDDTKLSPKAKEVVHAKMLESWIGQSNYDVFGNNVNARKLRNLEAKQSRDEDRVREWARQPDALETLPDLSTRMDQGVGLDHTPSHFPVTHRRQHPSASILQKFLGLEHRGARLEKIKNLEAVLRGLTRA